jgi:hypothetical protein
MVIGDAHLEFDTLVVRHNSMTVNLDTAAAASVRYESFVPLSIPLLASSLLILLSHPVMLNMTPTSQ